MPNRKYQTFKKSIVLLSSISVSLTLSGCFMTDSNFNNTSTLSPTNEESEEVEESNNNESAADIENDSTKTAAINRSYGDDVDPTDADTMAWGIGEKMYDFTNGDLSSEGFQEFLNTYASSDSRLIDDELSTDERKDIYNQLQNQFTDRNPISYTVSKAEVNDDDQQAVFYRKIEFQNGQLVFYKTTLVKQEGEWILYNDIPHEPIYIKNN